jgi:integrase
MATEQSTTSEPERVILTDKLLRSIKASSGKRTVWDDWRDEHGNKTGLCIKVSETGAKTFAVVRRVAGMPRPMKYFIGRYDRGDVTLADARKKALEVVHQMRQGVRPATKRQEIAERRRGEEEAKLAKLRQTEHLFSVVAERYIEQKIRKMRSAPGIEATLRRDVIPRFGSMPITDITRRHITSMMHAIKDDPTRRRPGRSVATAAGHALSATRSLFSWAIAQDCIDGLEHSPCTHVNAKAILDPGNETKPRDRVLSDDEVRLFMAATAGMPFPWGPGLRLLFLSGCRLREILHARWDEIGVASVVDDQTKREVKVDVLTVPGSRMKGKLDHAVPLTPAMKEIIAGLPRFQGGQYLFSPRRPLGGMMRGKQLLEKAMRSIDPDTKHFVLHDLRRSARSLMSQARVNPDHAERVLAHKIGGIRGVYDKYGFLLEKRDALLALNALVDRIVNPPVDNVVPLRKEAVPA